MRESEADVRDQLLVMLEVAPAAARPEVALWRPVQRRREGVELAVELHGVDAELAQVVAEHGLVLKVVLEIAVDIQARRIARAVELVRDHARIDAIPVRKCAPQAARAGKLCNAAADVELLAKAVVETAAE